MKIALIQNDPVQGDPGSSLADLDRLTGDGCGADIYVLPEMFATGQYIDPTPVVQTMDGNIVEWLKSKASELDAAVCGSLPIAENGNIYNRLIFAMPDGKLEYYDEHHLFTYSGEAENYTPGNTRVIVEFRGLRILLLICYDLRFPIFSRNHDDYDAVFYPANWPEKRILAWDTLLRARAIENQCYVIGVNRSGSDELGFYPGHSAIITPYGESLVQTDERPQMLCADLDLKRLAHFRTKFPVLQDADLHSSQ
ncbi:MAG: nitrilase family protein [Bacteroidaceae bacterium]|nr:nitrilase family protein [Bacteroidaceae bacterium]